MASPDGTEAELVVEEKARFMAEDIPRLVAKAAGAGVQDLMVCAKFVSTTARARLREAGVSYMDATGNTWVRLDRPAIYIERQGAESDPDPPRRGVQSLKGAKAGRIVRTLCDRRPPLGVRELARLTDTDPGYVTRVFSLLEGDDLIARGSRGEVAEVRWSELIRRWTVDYSLSGSHQVRPFLAPRGVEALREMLATYDGLYAVTGIMAVPPMARVSPARLLVCYVPSPSSAAAALDLRPADAGANVLLVKPMDRFVFQGVRSSEGLSCVALPQNAADLLTGSGRDPSQGEALLEWMAEHEDAWRT